MSAADLTRADRDGTNSAASDPRRPSRAQLFALTLLAPQAFRDELVGDLVEELATTPRLLTLSSREARVWLWRQIATSAPSLVRSRFTSGGAMAKSRWIASSVFAVVGSVQAWDSRVLDAPGAVIALVVLGLLAHALGLLLASATPTTFLSLVGMAVMLACAKLTSPTELPALGVIWALGFACCMLRTYLEKRASQASPPSATNAA